MRKQLIRLNAKLGEELAAHPDYLRSISNLARKLDSLALGLRGLCQLRARGRVSKWGAIYSDSRPRLDILGELLRPSRAAAAGP
eukprot:9471596-Pyramimonas_sp.AAC.1